MELIFLPVEIKNIILTNLTLTEILNFLSISKKWRQLYTNDNFWKQLVYFQLQINKNIGNWRHTYFLYHRQMNKKRALQELINNIKAIKDNYYDIKDFIKTHFIDMDLLNNLTLSGLSIIPHNKVDYFIYKIGEIDKQNDISTIANNIFDKYNYKYRIDIQESIKKCKIEDDNVYRLKWVHC